ncbi:MAG TPA: hypothetical protein VGN57_22740 [Pirellulaceae bacterium]|jgi:hypothetical protein|nr:hypothetical protein [Pirellulaceae bacterium]
MPAPSDDRSRVDLFRRIGGAALALCVAFGPAAFVHAPLLRGELPVFRDVRHFYQPMERRQQQAWSEGRVPLWNHSEGTGFPEFAEATAATFYPGKVVFALPLPWGVPWFLYFVGHAGIACFGARRFARSCRLSAKASLLAGAAYAASGELLFQSCNPVYLVGAAWLPWALAEAILLRRTLKLSHAIGLAASTTLAFLGGDPQTVYHVALLIAGAFLIEIAFAGLRQAKRRIFSQSAQRRHILLGRSSPQWTFRARFAGLLAFAAALTVGLSAIQLLPAVEWFRESDRALLQTGDGAEEREFNRYDFSVGPWRWADFFVPEALGSPFPIQRRWSYVVVPETRVWTPSYYLGLAPLLLLPAALTVSRTRRRALLPLGLTAASLGCALGHYGLGYFAKEIAAYAGTSVDLPSPWGGLYWLLAEWAPLYDLFRYPAKWMPSASLGIAVAGAAGLDSLQFRPGRNTSVAFAAIASAAFLLALTASWLPSFEEWWRALPIGSDSTFGPWDAAGALADLRGNLLHAAVAALAVTALTGAVLFRVGSSRTFRLSTFALVVLAALDPAIANRDLVPTGGYSPEPARTIDWTSLGVEAEGPTAMRYFRGSLDLLPTKVWKEASPDRLMELAEWERSSYFPRLTPGAGGPPALRSSASLEPADLAPFLSAWRSSRLTSRNPDASETIDRLEDLSVGLLILPPGVQPVGGEFVRHVTLPPTGSQVAVWRLPEAQPRWAVSQDMTLIARSEAAIANGAALSLSHEQRRSLRPADLRFFESDDQGVAFQHDFRRPTLLVWNDRFDSGWQATEVRSGDFYPGRSRPVGEVSGTGRFLLLSEPGAVYLDYRPISLLYGASTTAMALMVALAALAWPEVRRRRRRKALL